MKEEATAGFEIRLTGDIIEQFLPGGYVREGRLVFEIALNQAGGSKSSLGLFGDILIGRFGQLQEKDLLGFSKSGEAGDGISSYPGVVIFICGDMGEDEGSSGISMTGEGADSLDLQPGVVGLGQLPEGSNLKLGVINRYTAQSKGAKERRLGFVEDDLEQRRPGGEFFF